MASHRPLSSTTHTTTTTTTTTITPALSQPHGPAAATHKRTKSTPRASLSPSLTTLYLTNLRLLNLDLLPDWPSITPATLSALDARARIKAVEWSLYQLFRIHDRGLAAEKLQPFFPPLEPLQSINLRAALFRCLDGLKKAGGLGREVIVRKTMLDECAGEKFWEVCLAFSAVVLRGVLLDGQRKGGGRPPVAQRIGVQSGLRKGEREMLEPLVLAHRAELGKVVEEKRRMREGFERVEGVLEEKSEELRRRAAVEREGKGAQRSGKTVGQLATLHETLRKNWVGDEALKGTVVSGENISSADRVLMQPTDSFLERASSSRANGDGQAEKGILEDIEFKARSQNARMKRWQSMYDELQATRARPAHTRSATAANGAAGLRFDQHHNLNLDDLPPQTAKSPVVSSTKASYINRYDAILTAMREDLRRANGTRRNATAPVTQHPRKASTTFDAVAGAHDKSSQHTRSPPAQRSPSQQAAPFRPGLHGRVSSRSRSYQQPKVVSQREPIPLKSELFSPLKSERRGSQSPASAASSRPGSMLISPREEDGFQATSVNEALSNRSSDMDGTTKVDSAVGLGLGLETASPIEMDTSSKQLQPSEPSESSPLDFASRKPNLPPPTQQQPRPSLAERTRMSMAFTSTEDIRKPPVSKSTTTSTTSADTETPVPTSAPTTTLADRTRQSISHHQPNPNPNPKTRPSHTRTRSSILHPVNPFSTPQSTHQRARRSSFANASLTPQQEREGEGESEKTPLARRNVTPREKLFEASAEYDSVFKARPKVLLSPVGSPERSLDGSGEGEGSPLGVSPR